MPASRISEAKSRGIETGVVVVLARGRGTNRQEMAGGVIVPSDGPAADYGGGLTLSVFMTCLVAASGGLIFGYDIGISGACVRRTAAASCAQCFRSI